MGTEFSLAVINLSKPCPRSLSSFICRIDSADVFTALVLALSIVIFQNFNLSIWQFYNSLLKSNPATEAAGPCVNKKLGGGLSANHVLKINKYLL